MASGAMTDAQEQRWASQRLLLLVLWLMVMILAIKVWMGWATRSLSLIATALHTLITSFSLLLSFMAMNAPGRGSRELWGHKRAESSLTLCVAVFLGVAVCLLLGLAGAQLGLLTRFLAVPPDPIATINLALLQLLGGVTTIGLLLGLLGRYQAHLWGNAMLRFSFGQSLQDAGLMALAIAGLGGVMLGLNWLDPVLTIALVLVALSRAWHIINHQLPSMMQQVAIAPEALTAITHQVEGILHCYGVQSRGMVGRLVRVELRLILHPECTDVAAAIAQRVERLIVQHYGPAKVHIYFDGLLPKR